MVIQLFICIQGSLCLCMGKSLMTIRDPLEIPSPGEKRKEEGEGGGEKGRKIHIYKYTDIQRESYLF